MNNSVIFLDEDLKMCDMAEVVSCRKKLKLYEVGSIDAEICNANVPNDAVYIYLPEGGNLGIIERVQYSLDKKGIFTAVKAKCIEGILSLRCITDSELLSGTPDSVCASLVRKYCMTGEKKIEGLEISSVGSGYVGSVTVSAYAEKPGEKLGARLYSLLRPLGLSMKISCDYENSLMYFGVYKGLDRSSEQSVNSPVIFSESRGDIISLSAVCPSLPYTTCYVCDSDGVYATAGNSSCSGMLRAEYYLNVSSHRGNASASDYSSALVSAGNSKIKELNSPGYIDLEAESERLNTFNLGDICELECSVDKLCGAHRVICIDESYSDGERTTTIRMEI